MAQLPVIENGPAVRLSGQPAQGTRHDVFYGSDESTGEQVVVKLERTPGALVRERQALAALGTESGVVPRLRTAGTAVSNGLRTACLVIQRRPGAPPESIEGWRRMGAAYAHLADMPLPTNGLPQMDLGVFGEQHARRVSELGDRLRPFIRGIPDWARLASPEAPAPTKLTVTHGDPGPGNYLDDGQTGSIVDWEEAQIAPQGLDLARLRFIALLGAGPNGYRAGDHHERAAAARAGYTAALVRPWAMSEATARWWTAVAGVQFIHRRWQLGGPAPWEDAANVLRSALT